MISSFEETSDLSLNLYNLRYIEFSKSLNCTLAQDKLVIVLRVITIWIIQLPGIAFLVLLLVVATNLNLW